MTTNNLVPDFTLVFLFNSADELNGQDIRTEVWKGIQKQLEEKGYKIITLSVEEYKEK